MPFKNNNILHIIIAPNAFKHSLPADEAALALKEGLVNSKLNCTIDLAPVGDGGDGTGKLLSEYLKMRPTFYKTVDPLGRKITAPVYYSDDKKTAIIELSDSSGLKLLKPSEYNVLQANTRGTGFLIKRALHKKVSTIILAIGGSATIDGGAGILQALGVQFLDKNDEAISNIPFALEAVKSINLSAINNQLLRTEIIIICDVKNKLLGKNGAARVFGSQKGATKKDILQIERKLKMFDSVVYKMAGIKMSDLPHSGAAGGVAATLSALCNAKTVNGIDYFLDIINFKNRLKKADIVITGEGAIDHQTLQGKAPHGVALAAKKAGVPVIAVGGKIDYTEKKLIQYFDELICINSMETNLKKAIKNTRKNLIKSGKLIGEKMIQ